MRRSILSTLEIKEHDDVGEDYDRDAFKGGERLSAVEGVVQRPEGGSRVGTIDT